MKAYIKIEKFKSFSSNYFHVEDLMGRTYSVSLAGNKEEVRKQSEFIVSCADYVFAVEMSEPDMFNHREMKVLRAMK